MGEVIAICWSCLENPEAVVWLAETTHPIRLSWTGATCAFCHRAVGVDLAAERAEPHREVLAYDW